MCEDDFYCDDIPYDAGYIYPEDYSPDDIDPDYSPGDVRNINFDSCDYRPAWDETHDEFDGEW